MVNTFFLKIFYIFQTLINELPTLSHNRNKTMPLKGEFLPLFQISRSQGGSGPKCCQEHPSLCYSPTQGAKDTGVGEHKDLTV